MFFFCVFFFFFQAEDGIRDGHVTGVQTCALPIWIRVEGEVRSASEVADNIRDAVLEVRAGFNLARAATGVLPGILQEKRSEERRVGKECRCRWWTYQ